jgi:putative hydrolase of the HAD superfamily
MIDTLVLDFGAVLLPLNETLTWKGFEDLGAKGPLREASEIFEKFETGSINQDLFLDRINPHFFRPIFRNDLISAWNAMLISPIQDEIIDLLKGLKKRYRLFLLSNTNALHIANIKKQSGPFLYAQFYAQFEAVLYSHELGLRKPEPEIFEHLINTYKLTPENCLYVDDKLENIEAGEAINFKVWHFKPASDSIHALDKVLAKHRA